jgi:hypothetical protein
MRNPSTRDHHTVFTTGAVMLHNDSYPHISFLLHHNESRAPLMQRSGTFPIMGRSTAPGGREVQQHFFLGSEGLEVQQHFVGFRGSRGPNKMLLGSEGLGVQKKFFLGESGSHPKFFLTRIFWPFTLCFPLFSFFSFGGSSGPSVEW